MCMLTIKSIKTLNKYYTYERAFTFCEYCYIQRVSLFKKVVYVPEGLRRHPRVRTLLFMIYL